MDESITDTECGGNITKLGWELRLSCITERIPGYAIENALLAFSNGVAFFIWRKDNKHEKKISTIQYL